MTNKGIDNMTRALLSRPETDLYAPISNGIYYCSPRCGDGKLCTRKAFEQASKEASALAKALGEGWETVLWDNLGWHYSATKGVARVSPYVRGSTITAGWKVHSYSAELMIENQQFFADGKTPEDAYGNAVSDARTFVSRANEALASLYD